VKKQAEVDEQEYEKVMAKAGNRLDDQLRGDSSFVELSADEMGDIRFSRLADNADSYDRFE
jgi:hypothetical protein